MLAAACKKSAGTVILRPTDGSFCVAELPHASTITLSFKALQLRRLAKASTAITAVHLQRLFNCFPQAKSIG